MTNNSPAAPQEGTTPPEIDRAILSEAARYFDDLDSVRWRTHSVATFEEMADACRRAAASSPTVTPPQTPTISVGLHGFVGWIGSGENRRGTFPRNLSELNDDLHEFAARSTPPREEAPNEEWLKSDNGFPRANRMDLWTEAERAIQHAVDVCETTLPADVLETDAIILLAKAREKVARLVDREIRAGRMAMPNAAPMPRPLDTCGDCGDPHWKHLGGPCKVDGCACVKFRAFSARSTPTDEKTNAEAAKE